MQEKDFTNLSQITEPDVKYWFVNSDGKRTGQWVKVEDDNIGYGHCFTLSYKIYQNQLYNFATTGDYVKSWKTFNGAIRYAIKYFTERLN